jgi:hypothetical protein
LRERVNEDDDMPSLQRSLPETATSSADYD